MSLKQVTHHCSILVIKVMYPEGAREVMVSAMSLDLFPVGWCATNNINLTVPPSVINQGELSIIIIKKDFQTLKIHYFPLFSFYSSEIF